MITLMPPASDWDDIAALTGDASWRGDAMHRYFERLERCRYRPRALSLLGNPSGHGFDGWLTTETADPLLLAGDEKLERIVVSAAATAGVRAAADNFFRSTLDPNDLRFDWSRRQMLRTSRSPRRAAGGAARVSCCWKPRKPCRTTWC